MALREQLLEQAETRQKHTLEAASFRTLGPAAPPEAFVYVEEETTVPDEGTDPEVAEALARSKLLEFSKEELATIRKLSASAVVDVLTNGTPKDKMNAAKLSILMSKLENDRYLELKRQHQEALPKQRRVGLQLNQGHFLSMRQDLQRGLKIANDT